MYNIHDHIKVLQDERASLEEEFNNNGDEALLFYIDSVQERLDALWRELRSA